MKQILRGDFLIFSAVTLVAWIAFAFFMGMPVLKHDILADQHTRQALAWREGRMHLEENVGWLELVEYKDKIYISFPPTPTLIAFPLTFIFGYNTPNTFTLLIFTWLAMLFSFFIFEKLTQNRLLSFFMTLSFFWGSQILYLSMLGTVHNQGQLYGVFFAILALLIALNTKKAWSLIVSGLMLGLAVGCRPFYLFMLPLLLYLGIQKHSLRKTLLFTGLGLAPMGIFLALYNLARFGSIFEFGHNYLPLHARYKWVQFGFQYLVTNLKRGFISLPFWDRQNHLLNFSGYGTAIWIVAPVLLLGFYFFFKKDIPLMEKIVGALSIFSIWFMLCLHFSNGWYQFGYRFSIDLIPLLIYFCGRSFKKIHLWLIPLGTYSIIINIYGVYWKYITPIGVPSGPFGS